MIEGTRPRRRATLSDSNIMLHRHFGYHSQLNPFPLCSVREYLINRERYQLPAVAF